jgi:NTE family protein
VIGALVARGLDDRGVLAAMRELVAQRPFSGLTLPTTSLLSGTRLTRALDRLFGDARIEDLWLPYACVACSLGRGSVEAPSRGPLALWLRASNAVPGIVPPVAIGGELYVDGGVLDNVPVDVAARHNAGPVIAVNVSGETALRAPLPDGPIPSGWGALGRDAVPGLGRILMRSMLLASAGHSAATRSRAALYLSPPLEGADPADWHALEALADAGYHHAVSALEAWDPWMTTTTTAS